MKATQKIKPLCVINSPSLDNLEVGIRVMEVRNFFQRFAPRQITQTLFALFPVRGAVVRKRARVSAAKQRWQWSPSSPALGPVQERESRLKGVFPLSFFVLSSYFLSFILLFCPPTFSFVFIIFSFLFSLFLFDVSVYSIPSPQ